MIERRRRERINECLNQLQTLISQLDKDKPKVYTDPYNGLLPDGMRWRGDTDNDVNAC